MKKVLRFRFAARLVFLLCATPIAAPAQTFTTLLNFDGTNGARPYYGFLVQGVDGSFYGTTVYGGANFGGTVFKITPGGTLTTLYSLCAQTNCTDGSAPYAGLVQATDGNFYGTTQSGGANFGGTVFKITPEGTFTTLYDFCSHASCIDGYQPYAGLVQGIDGTFYGTTERGGTYDSGTVFKITFGGTLTTLYSFCAKTNCSDGASPFAGLVQGTDGNFYGTTDIGGTNNVGTVFKITSGGALTTTYSFVGYPDGLEPFAGLIQATDGNFYGTTSENGGTVFKITPGGKLTTIYTFCRLPYCADGSAPYAGLVQATDGNFYGTTQSGGANSLGTVFKVISGGALITVHRFDSTDGAYPLAALVQATDGSFYGTTNQGGASTDGTVFRLSVSLGPFVQTLPTVGKVGSKVIILGNGLTGATSVTFNGTAAAFTVASPTEIKATVPTGATSGKVQVTTPHGTLTSNVMFRVK
jgi:uncharacterized repeat protein (TIGR03803 family)